MVRLRASETEDRLLVIRVTDSGIGIPEESLESIFDDFQQVDASRGKYEGTGLGLSITRGLTQTLGGNISATSEEGKGAEFTVQIPAVYNGAQIDV